MRASKIQALLTGMAAPAVLATAGCFAAGYTLWGLGLVALTMGLVHAGWRAVQRGPATEAMHARAEYDRLHEKEHHDESG